MKWKNTTITNHIALGVVICLLISFPLFFRMDFSKSDFHVSDFLLSISPNAFPYLIVVCCALAIYLLTLSKKASTFFVPVVIVLLYFSMYTGSQYPSLSDKDYLLHGRLDTILLTTGHLPSVSDPANYYVQWPGTFLLRAQTSLLLGIPELDAARLLSFIMPVVMVLFLYVLAKDKLGPYLGGVAAGLFLVSNLVYTIDQVDHFCPQMFSITLFLLILYLSTREVDKKNARVTTGLIVLFSFAIFISHPATPFFLLPALLAIWLFNAFMKRRGDKVSFNLINFLLVTLVFVLFITWSVFFAGYTFADGISQIVSLENQQHLATQVQVYQYPTQLLVYLSYYWKVLAVAILVPSVYFVLRVLRRKVNDAERKFIPLGWVLLGIAVGGIALAGTSLLDLPRVLTFLLFPACLITVFVVAKYVNVRLLSALLILLVIPGFLTIYAFPNEYKYYQHPFELTAAQWLAIGNTGQLSVTSDYDTLMVYSYYEWHSWPKAIIGDEEVTNYSLPINASHPFFSRGDFMIRSIRQEYLNPNQFQLGPPPGYNYWSQMDNYAISHFDLIYCNGFNEIYTKNYAGDQTVLH